MGGGGNAGASAGNSGNAGASAGNSGNAGNAGASMGAAGNAESAGASAGAGGEAARIDGAADGTGGTSAMHPDDAGATETGIPRFILGADVSSLLERERAGAQFYDKGTRGELLSIMKSRGFNYVRIRTWVDPTAAGGYAAGKADAWCDLAHTITLAQRVKQAGMGFLLNPHFSDTWADPGHQAKPAAWATLPFAQLRTALVSYTTQMVSQLKAAGVTPQMVQIGNEITGGMLWEEGKSYPQTNFANFATLLKDSIAAVKAVDPSIQIMLHIDRCDNIVDSHWWIDSVLENQVPFDILGESCYSGTQGTPADWKTTFADLAARYPKLRFAIAEYSEFKREANDVMFNLPGRRGVGTFIWEPTYWLEKIFTQSGSRYETNALMDLYPQMATAYGL